MEEMEVSMGKTLEHIGHEPSLNWWKILWKWEKSAKTPMDFCNRMVVLTEKRI